MKTCNDISPTVFQTSQFLSEYAVELFGSGCTCIRLDKNIRRIARSLGMDVEFSVLPRHLHITVSKGEESSTAVVGIREMPISFSRITDLSRLSWEIADGKVSFEEAKTLLPRIYNCKTFSQWQLVVLVSIANASFCRLFNGDWFAMLSVFAATFIGFRLKQILSAKRFDFKLTIILCAFISAVITALGGLTDIGQTPDVAVATSVLYLVPGIPFINSFCDFIDGHYLCAFGRLMHAIMILCCLSIGLYVGMMLMHLGMF